MASESEDPELDFTDYMEKQKAELAATSAKQSSKPEEEPKLSPVLLRGIIFFGILLALLGVLIFLYMSRPETGGIVAPDGYRIDTQNGPPRLQKIQ